MCALSSAGEGVWLRTRRPGVRIPQGVPKTPQSCKALRGFCIVLTKATPGYAGGQKELIARGGVDKKKSPS